jgi:hypothetical protein
MSIGYQSEDKIYDIKYESPCLSLDGGKTYTPKGLWTPVIDPDNIAYYTLFKTFNTSNFLSPRLPIDMGLVNNSDHWYCNTNVLRMPIKFPNTEYRVPKECKFLMPLIKRAANYESFINPRHDECFTHITFDKATIDGGQYHRFPGFHVDGLQGAKLSPKTRIEHSYILVSAPATEFCLQPFFVNHLDEAKHNFFLEFDKQAKETNVYSSLPNHLYLVDPYMVHRSPKITSAINRVVVRITYAFTELKHPKNTINPLFDGQIYDNRLDIRQELTSFEFETPLYLYGMKSI